MNLIVAHDNILTMNLFNWFKNGLVNVEDIYFWIATWPFKYSNIEIFIENTYDDNGNLTRRDTTERVVDPINENRVEIFSFIYEFA